MTDVVGKATLEFGADNSGVKATVQEVGREVNKMATVAATAAVKASGSLRGIATTAERAAQKLTVAQERTRKSLEREANTYGKSRAAAARYKAEAAGLPRDVYEPLVAQIEAAEAAVGKLSAAQRVAADSSAKLIESEGQAAARYRDIGQAAVERAAALQRQVEQARAAAIAERELSAVSSGAPHSQGAGVLAGQNRGFQELTRDINEVNAALAAIERGAGSQSAIRAQTDKLVSLWSQGRITAEQYGAAVKRLDASEAALARSSAQAAAQGERFIAGLREQAETAGMTARQLLEYRAAQLGVGDRAAPLIARLAQADRGLNSTGVSARRAATALSMIPVQMTHIATQIAGGQNPLFILMQQGGILERRLGGIGPMFRTLAGAITPFTLAAGAVAAAVAAVGYAAYEGAKETREFANSLILTGNYAGQTAQQLSDMSRRVGEAHSTVGRSADVLNKLVASGRITGDSLEKVAGAIVNMSATGARSVDDLVAEFVRLGESPSRAVAKINESMHFLDAATYERIRALEQQGQKEQAVALAQSTLADATNRAADRVRASLGTLERGWNALGRAASKAWDDMLNIGRPTPIAELRKRAEELKKTVESLKNNKGFTTTEGGAAIGGGPNLAKRGLKKAEAELADTNRELRRRDAEEEAARREGQKAQAEQEKIAASDRLRELMKSTRSRAQIRADEIKQMLADAKTANWTAQQIAEAEKRINEKYQDKKGASYKDDAATRRLAELRQQEASLDAQLAGEKKLTDASKQRAEFEREIADLKTKKVLTADQKSLLARQKDLRAQLATNEAKEKEYATKAAILKMDERSAQIQQAIASSAESRQEQYDRQLGTAGLGQAARQRVEAENAIRMEFKRYQDQLAKATPKDQLGSERFREEQGKIRDSLQAALADQKNYYDQVDKLNGDWRNGAREAFSDYAESAANVAQQAQGVFSGAFLGMEDALTRFVTTGKASFKDLATSILADLARIAARQAIVGAIGSIVGSLAGGITAGAGAMAGGSMTGNVNGMSGTWGAVGGRALGGPVSARQMYEVNERGMPEVAHIGDKSFLLMGAQSGYVSPLVAQGRAQAGGIGAAPNISIQVNVTQGGGDDQRGKGQSELGDRLTDGIVALVRREIDRANRPGGVNWNKRNGRA